MTRPCARKSVACVVRHDSRQTFHRCCHCIRRPGSDLPAATSATWLSLILRSHLSSTYFVMVSPHWISLLPRTTIKYPLTRYFRTIFPKGYQYSHCLTSQFSRPSGVDELQRAGILHSPSNWHNAVPRILSIGTGFRCGVWPAFLRLN